VNELGPGPLSLSSKSNSKNEIDPFVNKYCVTDVFQCTVRERYLKGIDF
jgi:hypothetical protein